ncbi:MAG: acyl-CoA thioesterase [Bacteroidetes bacterium]|nr:acyl-CoA thioesterase [Bacteroidota bacterium]
MKEYSVYRLVKGEDLNHHGTLFAGRTAEWFVESSFVAASCLVGKPDNIVCINIHGMQFKSPVKKGEVVHFRSKVAHLGYTSITIYTKVSSETENINFLPVEGFITFVHINEKGEKVPHNLILDAIKDEDEKKIRDNAIKLFNKNK